VFQSGLDKLRGHRRNVAKPLKTLALEMANQTAVVDYRNSGIVAT
jgi:hypothetical protein